MKVHDARNSELAACLQGGDTLLYRQRTRKDIRGGLPSFQKPNNIVLGRNRKAHVRDRQWRFNVAPPVVDLAQALPIGLPPCHASDQLSCNVQRCSRTSTA